MSVPPPQRVYYVAYGSNLLETRFLAYVRGGQAPGNGRLHAGCRDSAVPDHSVPAALPYRLRFARHGGNWGGGGVCFLDVCAVGSAPTRLAGGRDGERELVRALLDAGDHSVGRAYRITLEQFNDVVAQECAGDGGATAGVTVAALDELRRAGAGASRVVSDVGWYSRVVFLGDAHDGTPLLTFTSPDPVGELPAVDSPPSAAYRDAISAGLRECVGWDAERAAAYIDARVTRLWRG